MVIRENLCKKMIEAETQRIRNSQFWEGAWLVQKQARRNKYEWSLVNKEQTRDDLKMRVQDYGLKF